MEETEENTSLPEICTKLGECIDSESSNPRRRLSLRTSAVLVEGATRIYRQELDKLMEDLSELDRAIFNRNKRKSTDSEGNSATDSSKSSAPHDTPEHMMHQIRRHSDVSIQNTAKEPIRSVKAPDISHSLSSINNSTNSKRTSRNDGQNGQSEKRRKMSNETNRSSEYPSSPDVAVDRNADDLISNEEIDLSDKNSPKISNKLTNNAKTKSDTKTVENESSKSPNSPTFSDIFDFVAGLPNYNDVAVIAKNHREKLTPTVDRNSVLSGNKCNDKNVTKRKKVCVVQNVDAVVRQTDRNDYDNVSQSNRNDDVIVNNTDKDVRGDLSPRSPSIILPSTARKVLRNSRQNKKNLKRSVIKNDQASQTEDVSFHPNLPFGYLLIHDSYNSRYPSKIVLSSLKASVRNL